MLQFTFARLYLDECVCVMLVKYRNFVEVFEPYKHWVFFITKGKKQKSNERGQKLKAITNKIVH